MASLHSWSQGLQNAMPRQQRAISCPKLELVAKNSMNNTNNNKKRKRDSSSASKTNNSKTVISKCIHRKTSGFALISKTHIRCGEIIISEDPVLQIQTPGNELPNKIICSCCHRPLCGLRKQLKQINSICLPPFKRVPTDECIGFKCKDCNTLWCKRCTKEKHAFQLIKMSHLLWCKHEPLVNQYLEYSTKQKMPQLLLAAQAFIKIISHSLILFKKDTDWQNIKENHIAWWRQYAHPKWWNIHNSLSTEEKKKRKRICNIAFNLLFKVLKRRLKLLKKDFIVPLLLQILSVEHFGEVMGMLSCNVMVIDITSPCQEYFQLFDQLNEKAKHRSHNASLCIDNQTQVNSSDILPEAINGSGLYPLLSLANHHCDPNASIEFLSSFNKASLVATRNIQPNREIFITYIPTNNVNEIDFNPDRFRNYTPSRTFNELKTYFETSDDEDSDEGGGDEVDDTCSVLDYDNKDENDATGVKQRQEKLLEYGFKCKCTLCISELKEKYKIFRKRK
jgi:hypothetical protein